MEFQRKNWTIDTVLCRKIKRTLQNQTLLLLLASFFVSVDVIAQIAPGYYYIAFTDKLNSPFSLNTPENYLSQRALQRRQNQSISIKKDDLPINPAYADAVLAAGNIRIHHKLKWMNGVVVETYDTLALDSIANLPFVDEANSVFILPELSGKTNEQPLDKWESLEIENKVGYSRNTGRYGASEAQVNQIYVNLLHDEGYRGSGMQIAIMDGGFSGLDTLIAYQNLMNSNRVVEMYDFVNNADTLDFRSSTHGTNVLGCIAANQLDTVVGTAPEASFLLLRTENVFSETLLEEYHWAAAAEFADSAGADVFNTSLGYTTFDDPRWNHTYEDLDGKSSVITKAANRAASKGILVVNSAGNSGNDAWRYVGVPADGDSVLAVGAVDAAGNLAGFSSRGPSASGAVKPNVMATGASTAIPGYFQPVSFVNGTSFSGPVLAGAAACLWQANPTKRAWEIKEAIEQSAHLYSNPNDDFGYGIPHIAAANWNFTGVDNVSQKELQWIIYPNPAADFVVVASESNKQTTAIYSVSGELIIETQASRIGIAHLENGIYILEQNSNRSKLIIQH